MKNAVFWNVTPRGCLRTEVSGERIAFIIRVKGISEPGMLAVTSNRRTLGISSQRASVASYC
jgi:hypothetical protein